MADVKITFTIAEASVPTMVTVFGKDYQETITNEAGEQIPNPESKALFAKRTFEQEVISHTLYRVVKYRKEVAPPVDITNIITAG